MDDRVNYFQVLGLSPDADDKDIKEAYRYKVKILHPDRLMKESESVKKRADEDMKLVNEAYNVLKNPESRGKYLEELFKNGDYPRRQSSLKKPSPVVSPDIVEFRDIVAGQVKTASFTIRNTGGPYSTIWMSNPEEIDPDSWLRITQFSSLDPDQPDELPLKVEIEAEGNSCEHVQQKQLIIKLDEEQTYVQVIMKCKPAVEQSGTRVQSGAYSPSQAAIGMGARAVHSAGIGGSLFPAASMRVIGTLVVIGLTILILYLLYGIRLFNFNNVQTFSEYVTCFLPVMIYSLMLGIISGTFKIKCAAILSLPICILYGIMLAIWANTGDIFIFLFAVFINAIAGFISSLPALLCLVFRN